MSSEEKKDEKWVNNFCSIWVRGEGDDKKYSMSIPLAEPVTIKLQRYISGGGFAIEEVHLVPYTNDKGKKSIRAFLKKPEANEKYTPHKDLKFVGSIPPKNKGDGSSDF